jgi:c(7)-type cytochrome triheme protein
MDYSGLHYVADRIGWRRRGLRSAAALAVMLVAMAAAASVSAVPPGKVLHYEGGEMGEVVFSGTSHADANLVCIDCHLEIFGISGEPYGVRIEENDHLPGRFCGVCHDGEKVFGFGDPEGCGQCHLEGK